MENKRGSKIITVLAGVAISIATMTFGCIDGYTYNRGYSDYRSNYSNYKHRPWINPYPNHQGGHFQIIITPRPFNNSPYGHRFYPNYRSPNSIYPQRHRR